MAAEAAWKPPNAAPASIARNRRALATAWEPARSDLRIAQESTDRPWLDATRWNTPTGVKRPWRERASIPRLRFPSPRLFAKAPLSRCSGEDDGHSKDRDHRLMRRVIITPCYRTFSYTLYWRGHGLVVSWSFMVMAWRKKSCFNNLELLKRPRQFRIAEEKCQISDDSLRFRHTKP